MALDALTEVRQNTGVLHISSSHPKGSEPHVSPEAPTIPFFERLLEHSPEVMLLMPVTYVRQKTARKVIRLGNRQNNVGLFASRINRALVPYESTLEKQACALFESQPSIIGYISQPYCVRLHIAGTRRFVYPDFELRTQWSKALVDVKFKRPSEKRAFRERGDALRFYAEQHGMRYAVLTEEEIRIPRTTNAMWLYSLSRGRARPQLSEAVWAWLLSLSHPTFGDIFTMTAGYPAVRNVLATLALDGHLGLDLDTPLRDQVINQTPEEK